jgi:hypothetical protein
VYKGLAWLFLGVANTDALLYDDEWQEVGAALCTCCARADEWQQVRTPRAPALPVGSIVALPAAY